MKFFQGLSQALTSILSPNNDSRPTREMQSSGVQLKKPQVKRNPTLGHYVVLLSEIQTAEYRDTLHHFVDIMDIQGTPIFEADSLIVIGQDEQGCDIFSTRMLERLNDYEVWVIIDTPFVCFEHLEEYGIDNSHIIDSAGDESSLRAAMLTLYEKLGLQDFADKRCLTPASAMLENLKNLGIHIGPKVPPARVTIH